MSGTKGQKKVTRKVEVFRPGTFRAMNGQSYSFSGSDVAAMVSGYDPARAPAPVVVGHPGHDAPAFGWAKGFEVNGSGTLVAELGDLAPEFVSAVNEGRYRKVSMSVFAPDAPNNPNPGHYYPRHIGFLGGAAPAVSGLAPVQFADDGDEDLIEIAFSLPEVTESTASVMRSIREFFIEKFGLESADQAVPEYHIRWIEEAGKEPDPGPGFTQPPEKEPAMPGDDDKSHAREAELAKRERALVHKENLAFADDLIGKGRLVPAQKARVMALLDELATADASEISFSDDGGEKKSGAAQILKDILSAAPEGIAFGAHDLKDDPAEGGGISFTAPDGLGIDQDSLTLHRKAKAYQSQNPGTDYLAAVQAVEEG